MRLIDADKLKANIPTKMTRVLGEEYEDTKYKYETIKAINTEPTVKAIPLDKPFCKMVYGDYVVYNKKWLVNHLQTEWNILQGKEYQP